MSTEFDKAMKELEVSHRRHGWMGFWMNLILGFLLPPLWIVSWLYYHELTKLAANISNGESLK